jgi:hypothetical protein
VLLVSADIYCLQRLKSIIMRVDVILNGTTRIVLIPENDVESAILGMVAKMDLEATAINQHTQILDKVVQDAVVIGPKKTRENESAQNFNQ